MGTEKKVFSCGRKEFFIPPASTVNEQECIFEGPLAGTVTSGTSAGRGKEQIS